MSKLSANDKFLDFSDYGRPLAKHIAQALVHTRCTPIHVTLAFGVSGLLAIYCILNAYYWTAGVFLILKSVLDAADGELSRLKKTPSYSGRYLDSIFDIILNFLFLSTICYITKYDIRIAFLAFLCFQWQGTLYNYYYVILRHQSVGGDSTSQIFENKPPTAFAHEKQQTVNTLFYIFTFFYRFFDKTIYYLDRNAHETAKFPSWFMSCLSIYGLGFQLLLIAILLPLGFLHYIIPFFLVYTLFIPVFVMIRRFLL
jgi:phosphatidylglycerophosphate synthase